MPALDVRRLANRLTRGWPGGVAGLALLLIVGLVSWWLWPTDSEPEATAGEVVSDFYLAQRDGDCELLLTVLSEKSWSDDGERGRDEFLDQCADATDGYDPSVEGVTISYADDGETAEVRTDWAPTQLPAWYGDVETGGRLVQEDGDWKIQPDEAHLRIGPPPHEALRGYLDAYAAGDCEAITTYVTEETWSAGGTLERDAFVQRCAAAAEARQDALPDALDIGGMDEAELDEAGRVKVTFSLEGSGGTIGGSGQAPETATLVKEGLVWRLEPGRELAREPATGRYLRGLQYADIHAQLVAHPSIGGRTCHNYLDSTLDDDSSSDNGMRLTMAEVDADVAMSRDFSSCYATVTIAEFADAGAARRAARQLADAALEWERDTVKEKVQSYRELDFDIDREEIKQLVRDQRPDREVDVPGHPSAIGVREGCDVDGCFTATVLLTQGSTMVGAHSQTGRLGEAAALLTAQLRRL